MADEILRQQEKVKELELLKEKAIEEEKQTLDRVRSAIDAVCQRENVFCGAILSPDDVAAIVKLAIESKETIRIGYNIYFNE